MAQRRNALAAQAWQTHAARMAMAAAPRAGGARCRRTAGPCAFLAALLLPTSLGLNNGLLRTPPMGFSDACLGGAEDTRPAPAQNPFARPDLCGAHS